MRQRNCYVVVVQKTDEGLGLSITGGLPTTCFVLIKKIFPHDTAFRTGKLRVGDVLLAADGRSLIGYTNQVSSPSLDISRLEIIIVAIFNL